MGDGRGARARIVAIAAAVVLMAAGLTVPQAAVATVAAPSGTQQELAAALTSYLATQKGTYSVSVRELDGEQRTVSLSGARRMEPASTIKLFYAWAVLRAVDQGKLSLADRMPSGATVGGCLRMMIEVSDNQCAIDFRLKLGMRNLNRLFASEGYANTYIALDKKGRYVTKRTSTDDLALLLSRLQSGELLSETQTGEFQKRLLAQIWRQRISSGVPPGTVVGSKSGQLWVSSGMVEADTAIVYGPQSTYVLTVMGARGSSGAVVRGISTIVYRHLQGAFTVKASYPAQQYVTKVPVYLHKTPARSRVTLVATGTAVQVLSSVRGWVRVKVGSRTGWVPFNSLSLRDAYRWPQPPAEPAPEPEPPSPPAPEPPAPAVPEATTPPVPEETHPPSPDETPTPAP